MREMFQTVLLRFVLCGLAASIALLVLRSRLVRDAFTRLMSAWRSLTAFGRVAVCSFLLIGILIGGDKTNSVPPNMNSPLPLMVGGGIIQGGAASCRAGDLRNDSFIWRGGTPHLLGTLPNSGFAEWKSSTWNVCGAWKDSFWLPFEEDWVFPHGSNHLSGVEVVSQGMVWPTPFDKNAIASIGAPVEIVRGLTTFEYEFTTSNSYRFVWTDAAINHDTNNLVTATLELFRDGGVCVTTNGVAAYLPRELPFDHHGFGQDDEWVAANFTNATEILGVGYPQWVDAQVGTDLTNGLYKLTVAVDCDPLETTQISVGELSIAVTNAGEYVFLLEKGPDYDFAVFPPSSNVTISAVDDIAATRGAALRGGFVETALPARAGGDGTWMPDGGEFRTDYVVGMGYARLWWLPWLCGSPDVTHIDANAGAVEFHANLVDYRRESPMFQWTASEGLAVASPNSQTTQVTADGAVAWARASMTVTASFGYDRSLVSYLYVSYGTESEPQVSCALSVQNVHFINEGDRPERVYPVSVSIICPVETNGVVDISHEGDDGALFWSDAAATQPLQSLSGISLSSVEEGSGGASYTFYMTSPNIGSGSFTATFTLPNGDTRGVAKSYRVIEPIRRLVCSEIETINNSIVNPSRITIENPAALRVDFNGQGYQANEIAWSVVSGPGTVSENSGTNVFVEATATSGTIVVEARFNNDAIQPRFVLPIVSAKTYAVRAFTVTPPADGIGWQDSSIRMHIDLANLVFAQVGIAFCLTNITHNVGTSADWDFVCSEMVKDDAGNDVEVLNDQAKSLLNTYSAGDCIEIYYAGDIRGCSDTPDVSTRAFQSKRGILIGSKVRMRDVVHELGHALGLDDCYVEFSEAVLQGRQNAITSLQFQNGNIDWGIETGRGFYERNDTVETVIMSLLMYGNSGDYGFDIPAGKIKALPEGGKQATYVAVGANDVSDNESEVYSQ